MANQYRLYWQCSDRSAWLKGGEFSTQGEAEEAIDGFRAELLGQCASDKEREDLQAGSFAIEDYAVGGDIARHPF